MSAARFLHSLLRFNAQLGVLSAHVLQYTADLATYVSWFGSSFWFVFLEKGSLVKSQNGRSQGLGIWNHDPKLPFKRPAQLLLSSQDHRTMIATLARNGSKSSTCPRA